MTQQGTLTFFERKTALLKTIELRPLMTGALPPPPPPLTFVGTGLRLPTNSLTASGNNYKAGDFAMGMPDWDVDEIWFLYVTFYANTTAEFDCDNGYTLEGMATRGDDGVRTLGMIDGGTDPVIIDPSNEATRYGKWVRFNPAEPIPAGSTQVFSAAQYIPDGPYPRSRVGTVAGPSIFGGTTKDERSQGSSSSMLSTLSGSVTYSGINGGIVMPSAAMVRRAGDRQTALIIGTSIDYGAHQTAAATLWTDRHAWGYMEMGLDDNVNSLRIPALNWAIPSWGHESTGTTKSQADVTACSRQLWAMAKARELNEGRPLVDMIWSGHGTNTSNVTTDDYRLLAAVWRGAVGTEDTPFYQAEMLPYSQSTDGYATLENQTVSAERAYPNGSRWMINAAIGGPDGLGDPTAELRADGTIQGSFAPWRVSAWDLTTNRDKFSVRPLNGVLTSNYSGSGPMMMDISPPVGDYFSMVGGGNTAGFKVLSVSGSGPYSVTGVFFNGNGVAFTAGAALRSIWHDVGGLHPGAFAHRAYAYESLVPFKVALGFDPILSAPTISDLTAPSAVEDGETIAVTYTVTGSPAPTILVQPQVDGANAGTPFTGTPTGFSYEVNGTPLGISPGQTLSFEVTVSNSEGSDMLEPSMTYSIPASSLFDTSTMTLGGGLQGDEIIDGDSFRGARVTGGVMPVLTLPVTAGATYRIRFTRSAYDGTGAGITGVRLQMLDGTTIIEDTQAAGFRDVTRTMVSSSLVFRAPTVGSGGRIDGLLVTAA